jgi:hypothetical protein
MLCSAPMIGRVEPSFAFVGGALKQPSMFALLAEPATGRNRLSRGASLCSY